MTTQFLRIVPRDPMIARDGRPFGAAAGHRMRSLDWPLPSTLAGAVRTLLGTLDGGDFTEAVVARLKSLSVHGPLPFSDDQLFFPAPADAACDTDGNAVRLRPEACEGGVDLPFHLSPLLAPPETDLSKYGSPPAWWSLERMQAWLVDRGTPSIDFYRNHRAFRESPEKDERTHVKIDAASYTSSEGMLFTTTGLVLDHLVPPPESTPAPDANPPFVALPSELSLRVDCDSDQAEVRKLFSLLERVETSRPIGGERRISRVSAAAERHAAAWQLPDALGAELASIKAGDALRMVLATPAIFSDGWRPGWLKIEGDMLVGTPPGISAERLRLKLKAVANGRWDAVSGWSYEEGKRGPKPVRRMVPAGATYLFEVVACEGVDWSRLWLDPVSDGDAGRDGFGLAVWGL